MPTQIVHAKSPRQLQSAHRPNTPLSDATDGTLGTSTTGGFTEYDSYLKLFTEAMRYKLRLNSHKGFLGDVPVAELLPLLKKEVAELEEALLRNNHVEAMLEGADIANFAFGIMMKVMRGAAGGV